MFIFGGFISQEKHLTIISTVKLFYKNGLEDWFSCFYHVNLNFFFYINFLWIYVFSFWLIFLICL